MKSTMIRTLFAASAALALALAPACSKDKKDGEGGESAEAEGGGGGKAGTKTSFAVFPKEYQFVLGISGDSIRSSGLFKGLKPDIDKAMTSDKDVKEFIDACGVDPTTAIKSVIIGGVMGGPEDVTVVVKGLKRAQVQSCIEGAAKQKGEDVKVAQEGKLTKVTEGTKEMYLGWIDDSTFLTGPKAEKDKAWVEARLAAKDGLDTNEEIMGLLKGANSKATVWFAGKPDDNSAQGMAMMLGGKPAGFFGAIDLAKGLNIDISARFSNAEDAKKAVEQANAASGGMKADPKMGKYLEKTKIEAKDSDMHVLIDLNDGDVKELTEMVKTQLPQLMMMMGGM